MDQDPTIQARLHAEALRLESRLRRRFRHRIHSIRSIFDSDDLIIAVHEVIARVGGAMSLNVDSAEDVERFLYALTRNIALKAIRHECRQRRRWQKRAIPDLYRLGRDDAVQDPDELQHLLEHLTAGELDIVTRYARGESHLSIAESLGISTAAFKSRWHRLRERLRRTVSRGGTCGLSTGRAR